jgi:hypothetical protein
MAEQPSGVQALPLGHKHWKDMTKEEKKAQGGYQMCSLVYHRWMRADMQKFGLYTNGDPFEKEDFDHLKTLAWITRIKKKNFEKMVADLQKINMGTDVNVLLKTEKSMTQEEIDKYIAHCQSAAELWNDENKDEITGMSYPEMFDIIETYYNKQLSMRRHEAADKVVEFATHNSEKERRAEEAAEKAVSKRQKRKQNAHMKRAAIDDVDLDEEGLPLKDKEGKPQQSLEEMKEELRKTYREKHNGKKDYGEDPESFILNRFPTGNSILDRLSKI